MTNQKTPKNVSRTGLGPLASSPELLQDVHLLPLHLLPLRLVHQPLLLLLLLPLLHLEVNVHPDGAAVPEVHQVGGDAVVGRPGCLVAAFNPSVPWVQKIKIRKVGFGRLVLGSICKGNRRFVFPDYREPWGIRGQKMSVWAACSISFLQTINYRGVQRSLFGINGSIGLVQCLGIFTARFSLKQSWACTLQNWQLVQPKSLNKAPICEPENLTFEDCKCPALPWSNFLNCTAEPQTPNAQLCMRMCYYRLQRCL